MSNHLKILVLILCTVVLGCYTKQPPKIENEEITSNDLSPLAYLFTLPIFVELHDAYFEENQHYPASKEELLTFCQSRTQYDYFDSDTLEQMWPFFNMLTISTLTRVYYEEKKSYPASKEELLAFCQSHAEYQSFNNDTLEQIRYELLDNGNAKIGVPIQTRLDGTKQYLEITSERNIDFNSMAPHTQEAIKEQIQKGLHSLFHEQ